MKKVLAAAAFGVIFLFSGFSVAMAALTAPTLTAGELSSTQIELSWSDSNKGISGYEVERTSSSTSVFTIDKVPNPYPDAGLDPDTTYSYRIRAYKDKGKTRETSAWSNVSTATTSSVGSGAPPDPPSGLTSTAVSSSQINLIWSDNSTDETGFKIERSTSSGGPYSQFDTVGANAESYTDSGLTASTTYWYRVRAYNTAGDSSYSSVASATTQSGISIPNPPNGLSAAAVSSSQINLIWSDNSTDETGFKIERSTSSGGPYSQVDTVGANVESYSNTSLSVGVEYWYRVRAYNTAGDSNYSNLASATPQSCATAIPNSPSSLSAVAISSSQVDLVWSDNSANEAGFLVSRYHSSEGWIQVGESDANTASFSDTGPSPSTGYYYAVRAYNCAGISSYSNFLSVWVPSSGEATPDSPSGLAAVAVSASRIDLTWSDNSGNETGFQIERATSAGGTYSQIATVGANLESYPNSGLSAGTEYWYRIRAYNSSASAYSNIDSAITHVVLSTPEPPNGLTATAVSSSQVSLSWSDNSSNESGFKVERATSSGGTYSQIATVGANVESYSNSGLNSSRTYWYRVRAYNSAGNSSYSNAASATTQGSTPVAPSGLSATAVSSSQVYLTWSDNSNNETGFKIERATSSAGPYSYVTSVGTNVESYSNSGLGASTTYWYRVRAYNSAGNSSYSNAASATTQGYTPVAPSGLSATAVSSSQVNLTWSDNSSNESEFKVERATSSGGPYSQIETVGANVIACPDTNLSAGITYFYRVRAYNSAGNSSYSNTGSATTSKCGNNIPEPGEECDDGNTSGGDGCSAVCTIEVGSAPEWSWSTGDAQDDRGHATAIDGNGNVLISGYFQGTVDFGSGAMTSHANGAGPTRDAFIAKYSNSGSLIWAHVLGESGTEEGHDIAVDSAGNVVMTGVRGSWDIDFGCGPDRGTGYDDIFLVKYAPSGECIWSRMMGGFKWERGEAVAVDHTGDILVGGYFEDSVDFGGITLSSEDARDSFVAKYTAAGDLLWAKSFGGSGYEFVKSVSVDASGNVMVAGMFSDSISFDSTTLHSAGGYDIFVAKLGSTGNLLWAKRFGSSGNDGASDMTTDAGGNMLVTGYFLNNVNFGGTVLNSAGGEDIFVAKYTPSGSLDWATRFGSTSSDTGQGIATDGSDVIFTGAFKGTVDFGGGPSTAISTDMFVTKYSSSGDFIWSETYTGMQAQVGSAVAATAGKVSMTGYFYYTTNFKGTDHTSAGVADIFLFTMNP